MPSIAVACQLFAEDDTGDRELEKIVRESGLTGEQANGHHATVTAAPEICGGYKVVVKAVDTKVQSDVETAFLEPML